MSPAQAWLWSAAILALAAGLRGMENAIRFRRQGVGLALGVLGLGLALWAGWGVARGTLFAAPWWFLCLIGSAESVRAQGLEQGGSDPMALWLRLGVAVVATFGERASYGCAALVVGMVLASYLCAGLAKARVRAWWNGRALRVYLDRPAYRQCERLLSPLPSWGYTLAGLSVLGFELMAPLVLFDVQILRLWVAVGALFHVANIFCFGLHRFLWVWVSAYPLLFLLVDG